MYQRPACERERPVEDPVFNPLAFMKTHITNVKEMDKHLKKKKKIGEGSSEAQLEEGEAESGVFTPKWIDARSAEQYVSLTLYLFIFLYYEHVSKL